MESMKRPYRTVGLGALALILVLAGLKAHADSAFQGPVYTVPQVVAGLRSRPQAWIGRPLLVHGRVILTYCPEGWSCPGAPSLLLDPVVPHALALLCPPPGGTQIKWTLDSRLDFFARFPILGPLIQLHLNTYRRLDRVGTFRIRVERSGDVCGVPVKYVAVLTDGVWVW